MSSNRFDPDEYLKTSQANVDKFDPDEYLQSSPVSVPHETPLAAVTMDPVGNRFRSIAESLGPSFENAEETLGAAARGAKQYNTYNFGDELVAFAQSLKEDPIGALRKLATKKAVGPLAEVSDEPNKDFNKIYEQKLAEENAADREAAEKHPLAFHGTGIASAALLPTKILGATGKSVKTAAEAAKATLAARAANAIREAAPMAAEGSLYSAGAAEGDPKLQDVAVGASLGGASKLFPAPVIGGTAGYLLTGDPEGALVGAGAGIVANRTRQMVLQRPERYQELLSFLENMWQKKGKEVPAELRVENPASLTGPFSKNVKNIQNKLDDIHARDFVQNDSLPAIEESDFYKNALREAEEDAANKSATLSELRQQIGQGKQYVKEAKGLGLDEFRDIPERETLALPDKPEPYRQQIDKIQVQKQAVRSFMDSINNALGDVQNKRLRDLGGDDLQRVTQAMRIVRGVEGDKNIDPLKSWNMALEGEREALGSETSLMNTKVKDILLARMRRAPVSYIRGLVRRMYELPRDKMDTKTIKYLEDSALMKQDVESGYRNKLLQVAEDYGEDSPEYRLFSQGLFKNKDVTREYGDTPTLTMEKLKALVDDVDIRPSLTKPNVRMRETTPTDVDASDKIQNILQDKIQKLDRQLQTLSERETALTEKSASARERKEITEKIKILKEERRAAIDEAKEDKRSFVDDISSELGALRSKEKEYAGDIKGLKGKKLELQRGSAQDIRNRLKQAQQELEEKTKQGQENFQQTLQEESAPLEKIISDIEQGREQYKKKGWMDILPKLNEDLSVPAIADTAKAIPSIIDVLAGTNLKELPGLNKFSADALTRFEDVIKNKAQLGQYLENKSDLPAKIMFDPKFLRQLSGRDDAIGKAAKFALDGLESDEFIPRVLMLAAKLNTKGNQSESIQR